MRRARDLDYASPSIQELDYSFFGNRTKFGGRVYPTYVPREWSTLVVLH